MKAPKQKVPLRVVRMLPETRQVLLFDKTKGTHVVAEVGQDVDGYRVDDIDDDEVTLIAPSGSEVILTAPWHRKADAKKTDKKADPAPQDPYPDATPAADAAAPADPYADPASPSSASASPSSASASPSPTTAAPIVAGDNGDRVVSASGAASTASGAPSDPYGDPAVNAFFDAVNSSSAPATKPAPATSKPTKPAKVTTSSADGAALGATLTGSPAPASTPSTTPSASTSPTSATPPGPTASAPSPGPTTATIKRADIDAALGDFAGTASTFAAAFTPQGLRFDAVADGSLLAKVGLQKGDVVTTVDGQPLRSLDDAANLYARLPTAHGSTLQVQRAGKPITLRIAIQ